MNTHHKAKPRSVVESKPDLATVFINRIIAHLLNRYSHLPKGYRESPNGRLSVSQITSAILLGEAIESHPGLEQKLCDARPIVLLKATQDDVYDDLHDLEGAFFERPTDDYANDPYDRFRLSSNISLVRAKFVAPGTRGLNGRRVPSVGEIDFESAMERRGPIIILLAPGVDVPDYLNDIEHIELEIGAYSSSSLRRIVTEAFSGPTATTLPASAAASVTHMQLRVAIHASDTADDCMRRLVDISQPDRKPPSSDVVPTPLAGISFHDLVGYGEAKTWGSELLLDLAEFRDGKLAWDDCPNRSILLSGPPGVGKTKFMHTLAKAANIPLVVTSVANWNAGGHLGASLKAIQRSFSEARAQAPAILFIDELDGIGSRQNYRGEGVYWSQLTNLLLTSISEFQETEGAILVAATNFPTLIDPAILRSGRLDKHVAIGLPTEADLVVLIDQYTQGKLPLKERQVLAKACIGSTGADVEVYARRARTVARRAGHSLCGEDFATSMGTSFVAMNQTTRRLVSVHEAGHVAVARLLGRDVKEVYLAGSGGITVFDPGHNDQTEADLMDTICIMMAGRGAEEVEFGKVAVATAVGASSDLAVATRIAEGCELDFGYGVMGQVQHNRSWRQIPEHVVNAIERRISDALARACALLVANERFHNELTATIFRTGRMSREEIDATAKKHGV